MKEIALSGKYSHLKCLLDDDWAEMFSDGEISIFYKDGYADVHSTYNGKCIKQRLHHVIVDFVSTRNKVIDHIDANKINNTRANLRVVTCAENVQNKNNRVSKRNKFGVRGVSFHSSWSKYSSSMFLNGKSIYFEYFDSLTDAKLVSQFNNLIRNI